MIATEIKFDKQALFDLVLLMVDKNANIHPVPFSELNKFSQNDISAFCTMFGIYQMPTIELIEWLENEIPDKDKCIEVGAGNGCIGRSLGIKMYDNMHQDNPEMQMYYSMMGQQTVQYGSDVIKMNGNKAVNMFKPDTVVSCWVTQKFEQGDDQKKPVVGSNMYGVMETDYIGKIKKYIHVGNMNVHHDKRMLRKVWFKEYKFPWLISRSLDRNKNIIHVFKCSK